MARKCKYDFTSGPMLKNMILYALPIIGVNILQLLFTATDLAVLGAYTKNDYAVAAVGATSQIINLMLSFVSALALAANMLLARCVGAKDDEKARRVVGTALFFSLFCGIIVLVAGQLLSETFLRMTNCPEEVLPYATTYLRIYFAGVPFVLLYNFCSSMLRAAGDSVRPLCFLAIGGIMNVALNIFFVVAVGWDIEGVAVATVFSKGFCAIACLVTMFREDGYAHIHLRYIHPYGNVLWEMLAVGLPLAFSKFLFSFANVMVTSEINKLGSAATTAQSITKEFDGFLLEAIHAVGAANLAVVSQNYGARRMDRVKRSILISLGIDAALYLLSVAILVPFGRGLCSLMTDTELVLELCQIRILTVSISYIFNASVALLQQGIRGIGYSFTSLLNSILSNVLLRILYMKLVLPHLQVEGDLIHNMRMLYLLYPATWFLGALSALVVLVILFRRTNRRFAREAAEKAAPLPAA